MKLIINNPPPTPTGNPLPASRLNPHTYRFRKISASETPSTTHLSEEIRYRTAVLVKEIDLLDEKIEQMDTVIRLLCAIILDSKLPVAKKFTDLPILKGYLTPK